MMRKLLLALIASGALAQSAAASGLEIEIKGEKANGTVVIDLFDDIAPNHVAQITSLANDGAYDGVAFHRVIDGFMAQTGDVEHGALAGNYALAGTGGSELPDLSSEFSDYPYDRGVVGMARSQNPNSANSQFFIMFAPGHFLNGQYTVVGKVVEGMTIIDAIKRGSGGNGVVSNNPDRMQSVTVTTE